MKLNFNSNLGFDEVMYRYAAMMVFGILAGVFQNWWFVAPTMLIFLTAILGWSPVKAYIQAKRKSAAEKNIPGHGHKHLHQHQPAA